MRSDNFLNRPQITWGEVLRFVAICIILFLSIRGFGQTEYKRPTTDTTMNTAIAAASACAAGGTGSTTSASAVYSGKSTTPPIGSSWTISAPADNIGHQRLFSSWQSAGGSYSSLTVNISMACSAVDGWYLSDPGYCGAVYSLDSGSTWAALKNGTGDQNWAQGTFSATISASQNLANLRVAVCARSVGGYDSAADDVVYGSATATVYDIWTAGIGTSTPPIPTISVATGTYNNDQSVTLTSVGSDIICYRTDGGTAAATTPGTCDAGSSTYSSAIAVSTATTLSAVASKTGGGTSTAAAATYTFTVATPTFSPVAGTYGGGQNVTVSSSTTSAVIHSTVDGTTPTCSSSTTSPISIPSGSVTIKSIACRSDYTSSAVGSAAYTIVVAAAPTASPAASTYLLQQFIELNSTTSPVTIYYTTDGTTPTYSGGSPTGTTHLYNGVSSPVVSTATQTAGGTCTSGTLYYKITATSAAGESLPSTEVTSSTTLSNYYHNLSWIEIPRATGYKVYRTPSNTAGIEQYLATISSGSTVTFADGCSASPSGAAPPTYNSSAVATTTAGTTTINTIAVAAGYGDSTVQTFSYVVPVDSSALITDDLSNYYDANLGNETETQYPLDALYTNGKWLVNGSWSAVISTRQNNSAANYITAMSDNICTASSGHCFGASAGSLYLSPSGLFPTTTYVGATINNDQWAQILYRSVAQHPGVGVRCSTTGAFTGYFAYANYGTPTNSYSFYKFVNGSQIYFQPFTSAPSLTNGQPLRLRVIGSNPTTIQAQANGVVIFTYTDNSSPITSGGPCISVNGEGYSSDFTAGGVGNSTYSANSYTPPALSNFTDAANTSDWKPYWPWYQSMGDDAWAAPTKTYAYSGGYGLGTQGPSQYEIRKPVGPNQFIETTITLNPDDGRVSNWFQLLQHQGWVPGSGTNGSAIDLLTYYIGVETMEGLFPYPQVCGTTKREYNCTPFLHVTKVTPVVSMSQNDVITVVGTTYSPTIGDILHTEYVGNRLRSYCSGHGDNPTWATTGSSVALSLHYMITDRNGNLQIVRTAGTTGSSEPATWGTTWDNSITRGALTNDGTVKWMYYGKPCPTNTVGGTPNWSLVFDVLDNDLSGNPKGKPGLWWGENTTAGYSDWAPVFNNVTSGTVTNAGLCTTLPRGCSSIEPWVLVQ